MWTSTVTTREFAATPTFHFGSRHDSWLSYVKSSASGARAVSSHGYDRYIMPRTGERCLQPRGVRTAADVHGDKMKNALGTNVGSQGLHLQYSILSSKSYLACVSSPPEITKFDDEHHSGSRSASHNEQVRSATSRCRPHTIETTELNESQVAGKRKRDASTNLRCSYEVSQSPTNALRRSDVTMYSSVDTYRNTTPHSISPISIMSLPPSPVASTLHPVQDHFGALPHRRRTYKSPYSGRTTQRARTEDSTSQAGIRESKTDFARPSTIPGQEKPKSITLERFLACKCCPRTPKHFATWQELAIHEAKKPNKCRYCSSHFTNRHDAERHQNSIHLRQQFWSCSALTKYNRAFVQSQSYPGEADTCGYCGEEFFRSGGDMGIEALYGVTAPRHITDYDWEIRCRHLKEKHMHVGCERDKHFFRSDHFRQHLVHYHAGKFGTWNKQLQKVCMFDGNSNY